MLRFKTVEAPERESHSLINIKRKFYVAERKLYRKPKELV